MVLVAPIAGHFIVGWFGWLLFVAGLVWEIISILRSIQCVKGGWRGVIDGSGEHNEVFNAGIHWVWLGIWKLRCYRYRSGANLIEIPMSRRVAFTDCTGVLKKVAVYVTITNPVLASQRQNWRAEVENLVADVIGDWLQGGSYRNQQNQNDPGGTIRNRSAYPLRNFSQEAADVAAEWGLDCRVSLHVEPS